VTKLKLQLATEKKLLEHSDDEKTCPGTTTKARRMKVFKWIEETQKSNFLPKFFEDSLPSISI
jgi:hypothetical protein